MPLKTDPGEIIYLAICNIFSLHQKFFSILLTFCTDLMYIPINLLMFLVSTLRDFYELGDEINNKTILQKFVDSHFEEPGHELIEVFPEDWAPFPQSFQKIEDVYLRRWALHLHRIWRDLCRQVKDDVRTHQDRYSLLYVPHPFIIPGGRFREFYYWDTFWIVKGLLFSEMYETARGVILNLAYMVDQ